MKNKDAQQALRIEIIHLEREINLKQKLLADLRSTWNKVCHLDLPEKPRQVDDQTIANGLGTKVDHYDVPVTLKSGRVLQ
jgi:hypothetical protein